LQALAGLGVSVKAAHGGCAPITVCGPWKGGRIALPCPTSQYLSALLLAAPLAPDGVITEIDIPLLNEKPYVKMTLSYLDSQSIPYKAVHGSPPHPAFTYFSISGGKAWKPVFGPVPADFSSAAFPAAAAVISGGSVTLLGLDPQDTQGDKAFFSFLEKIGCNVRWESVQKEKAPQEWQLTVSRNGLFVGGEFDLNDMPDLLPALSAVACYARGDTSLVNVAHARIKETDRIAVMAGELGKLGVKTTERPDGLVIHGCGETPLPLPRSGNAEALRPIEVDGRGDHRVVMALACAALGSTQPVEIAGAESEAVTYPGFLDLLGAS